MSEKFFSNPTCGQVSHRVVRLRYEMNAAAAANSLAELLLLKQLRKVKTMCVKMVSAQRGDRDPPRTYLGRPCADHDQKSKTVTFYGFGIPRRRFHRNPGQARVSLKVSREKK